MTTVLFLSGNPATAGEWLRLDGETVVARGTGVPQADGAGDDAPLVAVAPADAVSLRWIDLPAGLSPAQAAAAARLAAAGLAAEPVELLHVALAPPEEGSDRRLIAITRADALAGWLERLSAQGLVPQRLLPAPMLLPAGRDACVGLVRDGLLWVRGPEQAFAAEPDIAAAIARTSPRLLDPAAFEAALPAALAQAQPDLLQGRFARRASAAPDWRRLRRLASLVAAILLVMAITDVARGWRASVAAEAARAQAAALARPLLPAGARVTDPVAQLAALGVAGGRGRGFADMAAALFAATRDSEGTTLDSLEHTADGRMRAALAAPSVAGLAGVETRLDALGFDAALGPVRTDGGRQRAELTIRAPS